MSDDKQGSPGDQGDDQQHRNAARPGQGNAGDDVRAGDKAKPDDDDDEGV